MFGIRHIKLFKKKLLRISFRYFFRIVNINRYDLFKQNKCYSFPIRFVNKWCSKIPFNMYIWLLIHGGFLQWTKLK